MVDDKNINSETEEQQDDKLECSVNIEDSGPWKKKVIVEISREEIDKEFDSQYKELRISADIPGFRKGRAPRRLIEKRYGEDVNSQTKLRLLAKAFEQIEEEQDFEILGEPDIDPDKIEMPDDGNFTFEYEMEIKPEFKLPTLDGIKVEKEVVEVTDERVAETIDQLRKRQGKMGDVDKAVADDHVLSNVVMTVDGVDEPEKFDEHPLWVSPMAIGGVRIEDMADVLKGVKVGDKKKCTAEVADTHAKEEYHGKKAEFEIEVLEVKRLILPEMDEAFLNGLGVADEAELKKMIQEGLESQMDQDSKRKMQEQVYKYLDENIVFDLPEGVAARHNQRMLSRRFSELIQQGVAQEQIAQNIEQLRESTNEQAARDLKMSFIMEEIAGELNIEVSEYEVNSAIAQYAATYQRRPERMKEELVAQGQLESIQNSIRDEKAIGRIMEMAEVVDAPEKKPEAKKAKPAKKAQKAAEPAKAKKTAKSEDKPAKKTAAKPKAAKASAKNDEEKPKTTRKNVKRTPPKSDS